MVKISLNFFPHKLLQVQLHVLLTTMNRKPIILARNLKSIITENHRNGQGQKTSLQTYHASLQFTIYYLIEFNDRLKYVSLDLNFEKLKNNFYKQKTLNLT